MIRKYVVPIDLEGMHQNGDQVPFAVAAICMDMDGQVYSVFYGTIDPFKVELDSTTRAYWQDDPHRFAMLKAFWPEYDVSPEHNHHLKMFVALEDWAKSVGKAVNEKNEDGTVDEIAVWVENGGYDSGRTALGLGLIGVQPLRMLLAGNGKYGIECAKIAEISGMKRANKVLKARFEEIKKTTLSAAMATGWEKLKPYVKEGHHAFMEKFWCAHNPLYDAYKLGMYGILVEKEFERYEKEQDQEAYYKVMEKALEKSNEEYDKFREAENVWNQNLL